MAQAQDDDAELVPHELLAALHRGTRIAVQWNRDERECLGTVDRLHRDQDKLKVKFDDGDLGWIALQGPMIRILPSDEDRFADAAAAAIPNNPGQAQPQAAAAQQPSKSVEQQPPSHRHQEQQPAQLEQEAAAPAVEQIKNHNQNIEASGAEKPRQEAQAQVQAQVQVQVQEAHNNNINNNNISRTSGVAAASARRDPVSPGGDTTETEHSVDEDETQDPFATLSDDEDATHAENNKDPKVVSKEKTLQRQQQPAAVAPSAPQDTASLEANKQNGKSREDDDDKFNVNDRIKVYWPEDEEWYSGAIVEKKVDKETGELLVMVRYDDTSEDWLEPANEKIELEAPAGQQDQESDDDDDDSDEKPSPQKKQKTAASTSTSTTKVKKRTARKQTVDSSISLRGARKSRSSSTTEQRPSRKASSKPKKNPATSTEDKGHLDIQKGSYLAVWRPKDKKFFPARVTSINPRNTKAPHSIRFDDNRQIETLDLAKRKYYVMNSQGLLKLIRKGTRVSVFWPNENQFFEGTVTQLATHNQTKRPIQFVMYDDGDHDWIDFTKWDFYLPEIDGTRRGDKKKNDVDNGSFDTGERVEVYWSGDDEFYSGRITKKKKNGQVFVKYDDNQTEWVDPTTSTVKRLSDDAVPGGLSEEKKALMEKLEIGSRVSVWWPAEKEFFNGSLTKLDTRKIKPHFVQYDDGDQEWLDLAHRKFELI